MLASGLFSVAASSADPETHKITVTDDPTHVVVGASSPIPSGNAAFGLFPEIAIDVVQDRRPKPKPCFGSVDADRRIVGAVLTQALSAAGYSVVPSAPLKIELTLDALECASDSTTKRHAAWRLSGNMLYGAKGDGGRTIGISGGRTVDSDFAPGTADDFRDIDTPQGIAAASMRDRLRDMFRSKQFEPE
jgi:hypothetical protein